MAGIRYREDKDTWIVDYFDNQGKRRQVKAGRVKAEAQEMLNKILADLHREKIEGDSKVEDKLFSEVIDEYKKYAESNKRKTTYYTDKYTCDIVSAAFGTKRLSQITVKDIQLYKDKLSVTKSKATVNRYLALIKGIYTKATEWGYAKDNPVKKVKLNKLNNARIRYLNEAEYKALMIHCDKSIRPFVKLAIHTGLRKSELYSLTWNAVNMERGSIHIRDSKNGEGRHIPINKSAREVLEELYKVRRIDSQDIFFDLVNFRRLWDSAMTKASLENFHFHDCRHTFASYAVMSGMDLRTLQEILGHKTMLMTLRYSHLSPGHKMDAMQKMDSYINKVDDRMKPKDRLNEASGQ